MSAVHPTVASPPIASLRVRAWVEAHQVGSFFILTFVLSWSLWLLAWLRGDGPVAMALFLLGGFGPMMAAAAITRYTGGSVRKWARQIVHWRVPSRFYLYALGLPVAIWTVINGELALVSDKFDLSLLPARLVASIGTFLVVLTVGGGFEEPGWRGFALGRLQLRLSPVRATLLLGFVWGLWHIPVYGPLAFPFIMMLAFFYTYLYNKTGSVLLPVLLHASFTPASDNLALVPRDIHGINDVVIFGTVLIAVIVLVVATRGRLGYKQGPSIDSEGRQGMSSGTQALQYPIGSTKSDVHVTGRRILGTFIDAIILGAAYNVLVAIFGQFDNPRPWEWHGTLENIPANILYGIGVVIYFVLMEGYLGQTFGKMVTGIAVIREDGAGPPGIGAALIRTVLRIADGLLGYAVAFIAVLASDKRQRLGDMAARTLVVRKWPAMA